MGFRFVMGYLKIDILCSLEFPNVQSSDTMNEEEHDGDDYINFPKKIPHLFLLLMKTWIIEDPARP